MKKLLLSSTLFFLIFFASEAQELGVRFGDVTGGDVAIDAVFSTSDFSRIHADLSFGNGGIGIDALFDFAYKPLGDLPFNWYAGVGPSLYLDDPVWLAAAAELGAEYRFEEAPISISVDWRPTLRIIETTDMYFDVFGINLRYVF